jgi:hypothetical protein
LEASNPIYLTYGLMKPGEGLAQILSKDKNWRRARREKYHSV